MGLIKRTHERPTAYVNLDHDAVVERFGSLVGFIDAVAEHHGCTPEDAANLVDTMPGPYIPDHPRVVLQADTSWGDLQGSVGQVSDAAKAIEDVHGKAYVTDNTLTNVCAQLASIHSIEGDWSLADMPSGNGEEWAKWSELGTFERARLLLRAPGAWSSQVFSLVGNDIKRPSAAETLKKARAETSAAA